jgi:hypothetical protein
MHFPPVNIVNELQITRCGIALHERNGNVARKTEQIQLNRKVLVQLQHSTNVHENWHALEHFLLALAINTLAEAQGGLGAYAVIRERAFVFKTSTAKQKFLFPRGERRQFAQLLLDLGHCVGRHRLQFPVSAVR